MTVLEAIRAEGIEVSSSCERGVCGTCAVGVLDGDVAHHDVYLTPEERHANNTMLTCVSSAASPASFWICDPMITLHDYVLSANCYKVRLLLAQLDLAFDSVDVDFHRRKSTKALRFENSTPWGTFRCWSTMSS